MKNFELNGDQIDFANVKTIMGTNRCFENVEKGAYFDGFGYAEYGKFISFGAVVCFNYTVMYYYSMFAAIPIY